MIDASVHVRYNHCVVENGRLRFSVLASGSSGNSVLVQGGGATVLVDAGLSLKETRARMASVGVDACDVDAVFVTHEHGDHVSHAGVVGRNLGVPVYIGERTLQQSERYFKPGDATETLVTGQEVRVGGLDIVPIPKPHDAVDPVGIQARSGKDVLGVFTDLGHVDATVGAAIGECTQLVFEANHDPGMLARGPYPQSVRRRVGGALGHISNDDAARALAQHVGAGLEILVLGHLSSQNNRRDLVRQAMVARLGKSCGYDRWISLASRATPLFGAGGGVLRRPGEASG